VRCSNGTECEDHRQAEPQLDPTELAAVGDSLRDFTWDLILFAAGAGRAGSALKAPVKVANAAE
jgi:hypothetical protein